MALYSEPQEVAEYIYDLLKTKAGELGIGSVGLNENLRPAYPAVVILPGSKTKELHATHKFQVLMEIEVYVYHARLDKSRPTRTREDLALVTAIENIIETGEMNMNGRVNFAYVSEVHPRRIGRPTGEQVVGTQMVVSVRSQKGFPHYGS